jgi:2'-5' RNA ligase
MVEQPSLPGFETGSKVKDVLFFAVVPDAEAAFRIAQLTQRLRGEPRLKAKPLATNHLHISLHGIGGYARIPEGIATAAGKAATTIAVSPFEVRFDRVMSFRRKSGKRPLVLCSGVELTALTKFQQTLAMTMAKAGLGPTTRFNPHITLLYGEQGAYEEPIEPIGWTVREFALVDSLQDQTRHITLGRWPLRGWHSQRRPDQK